MSKEGMYCGDGVYATFDGYYLAVDLRDQAPAPNGRVALEPSVLASFVGFARGVAEGLFNARTNHDVAMEIMTALETGRDSLLRAHKGAVQQEGES